MSRHVNDVTETGISWCGEILSVGEPYIKDLDHLVICIKHMPYTDICYKCLKEVTRIFNEAKNETKNT